jgi:lipoate-protein ligase A
MISAQAYNLPDLDIQQGKANARISVWQPDQTYIVIGRSNKADTAIIHEYAAKDQVPIMQRPSGGESVVLSPKMLVIATLLPIVPGVKSREYFLKSNDVIINVLQKFGVNDLSTRGISDISIGQKKILGSAIYRSQESVFYHAVLNVNEDIELISRYLQHPSREPDYRMGRKHGEFVTSLWEQGYSLSILDIMQALHNQEVAISKVSD